MKRITSILFVLLLMLASFTAGTQYPRGDVDYDGKVSITDVVTLIDYLLTGTWEEEPMISPDGHEYVDLGLPSGTLWANCNVGAASPEDYGDYFAWGEIEPKSYYQWSTYKWCNSSPNLTLMTKYCTDSLYGAVDSKTELDPEDDAAYMNWGSSWRMPTKEQLDELFDNCIWQWTEVNGEKGRLVIGPNGNKLFFPAAGYRYGRLLNNVGLEGRFWSRALCTSIPDHAVGVYFNSGEVSFLNDFRNSGQSVRPVFVPQE